ncbi:hypothetical protein FOZ61_006955 [Perkinsus olseni]|uniref:Thymus-specific serine protease n=1 Tax=Perkinsus olseni TaxID=32597 RepID=A0A7J6LBC6_PEROL|nr:hypothetical protein FOZ61_006955 [Perkinsus olseni]
MNRNGLVQLLNRYSWTEDSNSIWVDAPGPPGFSQGPMESDLAKVVENLVHFLDGLFKDHGNLNRDLHLVGTSASASLVAMLGSAVVKKPQLKINLKGVMMRHGLVGPLSNYQGCLTMANERKLLPAGELEQMAQDLEACETRIAKCNAGGPGGPPELGACKDATRFCDAATYVRLKEQGRSLHDVRARTGEDARFFEFKPGPVGSFLNRRDVRTKLGVAKKYFSNNEEVLDAFNKFTTYDTTSFVVDQLDGGIKVVVLTGHYDYVANAIGNLNWMTGLKGKDHYGGKLRAVQPKTLKYPLGGVFGTVRELEFATTGAKIAFINVTNGGHVSDLNNPRGFQRCFQDFLHGRLW